MVHFSWMRVLWTDLCLILGFRERQERREKEVLRTVHPRTPLFRYVLPVRRGDNLQLFISPLLRYEGWLNNIIDDKNFEINSLETPCTGGLKIPYTPMGTCRNAWNENFEFCFDCGKNVFQWTKKNHLGHFDWNCSGSWYPIRPNT